MFTLEIMVNSVDNSRVVTELILAIHYILVKFPE